MFHIGYEMVECLMRKANSAESKQDLPKRRSQVNRSCESRSQSPRVARKVWILDTLASALRWLL
jgi:hypothetical protein